MKRLRIALWVIVALAAGLFGLFYHQLSQPKNDFVQSAICLLYTSPSPRD